VSVQDFVGQYGNLEFDSLRDAQPMKAGQHVRDVHDETGSAGRVSRLVTVFTDPLTRTTAPFLSEWAKCQPGNTQNGRTVLPIGNMMADSES